MLTRAALAADLRTSVFGLDQPRSAQPTIGLELEFLPLRSQDHSVLPLHGDPSLSTFMRSIARQNGWVEQPSSTGAPEFKTWSGGKTTFEPGGQIEYSSLPFETANALLDDVLSVAKLLEHGAAAHDIDLMTHGIDPYHDITSAPLQLASSRYANMARYFETIGPAGARMMRQTSALQFNLSLGADPLHRWRLLNCLAAPLIALFANSRFYAGQDTGYASYRARVWRDTDPARTGVFSSSVDPIEEYLDFALNAPVILSPYADKGFRPFEAWLRVAGIEEWRAHLTTLFPEVRPKGYFEIRSIDAQAPARYAAVVALICGLVLDDESAEQALMILPKARIALLARAAKCGKSDPEFLELCTKLIGIAEAGCLRLGRAFLSDDYLRQARTEWMALLEAHPTFSDGGDSSARIRLPR
jgi:glutamate--cysteine ligase